MDVEFVLTAIAEDRPGLVETLAETVARHSGNWIDSDMARLGGEFAGILKVSVPQDHVAAFRADLNTLGDQGISVTVRKDSEPHVADGRRAHLDIVGRDHSGIVLEVTRMLAQHNVNVDQLHTSVFAGSVSGEPMFSAQVEVILPEGIVLSALRGELEDIAGDLMVEVELEELREI